MTARLNAPVTERMHQNYTRLSAGQTVGEALATLRRSPPSGRIIYFYVVDDEGRLKGVVPTRRLLLSPPEAPVTDIMIHKMAVIPAHATVLEACELFILHRLLAFPVVDDEGRLLGVVDADLYAEELDQLGRATLAGRLVAPLARFLHIEASSGVVLLATTAAALLLANSALAAAFSSVWEVPTGFSIGGASLIKPLRLWIDDGLMTLFFFLVGLEIKRELVDGELADPRKALLPVVAAFGGMVVPALVYTLVLGGRAGARGWAVPMATDIAFVVGVLTLLGPRVPAGLKVLLLTLAIADDIGAVLVIAVAFSADISLPGLGLAAGGLGLVLALRWMGARAVSLYVVLGAAIWLAFLKSGVHPTVAGVILGLMTPARPLVNRRVVLDIVSDMFGRVRAPSGEGPEPQPELPSPLERLESGLHPWVAFVIMPLFALANAGVAIDVSGLTTPVSLSVALGLLVGKPVGVTLFSWVTVRLGLTRLPRGVNWTVMAGAGCLAGIGFTMSLFMAGLAFEGDAMADRLRDHAKIGILAGSTLSGLIGCLLLLLTLPTRAPSAPEVLDVPPT